MSNASLSNSLEPITAFTYSSKIDVASSPEALQQMPCATLALPLKAEHLEKAYNSTHTAVMHKYTATPT